MSSCAGLILAAGIFTLAGLIFKFALSGYVIMAALCWVLAAVLVLYAVFMKYRLKKTAAALSCVILAGVVLFVGIEIPIIKAFKGNMQNSPDYLIVLGAGLHGSTPSLTLQSRIDRAVELMQEYTEAKAVLTGGKGEGETITEAEAMYRSMTAQGIAEERLIKEEKATSTRENLIYSSAVIQEREGRMPEQITVVSSEFHLCRAQYIANSLGMEVETAASKTPILPLKITYMIREAFGMAHEWVKIKLNIGMVRIK